MFDGKSGKWKDKRIYASFTSGNPSPHVKKEAEYAAAEFQLNKSKNKVKKQSDAANLTLTEAIDMEARRQSHGRNKAKTKVTIALTA